MADPSYLNSRYVFTLTADITATPVGETPTGYRVDIQYQTPGEITTKAAKYVDDWLPAGERVKILELLNAEADTKLGEGSSPDDILGAIKTWRDKAKEPKP